MGMNVEMTAWSIELDISEMSGTECSEINEQLEMDAVQEQGKSPQETAEQLEMDAALEADAPTEEMLGEYRIFCDTRPAGSRYKSLI